MSGMRGMSVSGAFFDFYPPIEIYIQYKKYYLVIQDTDATMYQQGISGRTYVAGFTNGALQYNYSGMDDSIVEAFFKLHV